MIESYLMDKLIKGYQVKLVEPGCEPGSGSYGVRMDFANDISPVFPYLNAVLDSAWYDHENKVLIWRGEGRAYAFRPNDIRIARVEDMSQARLVARETVDRINTVWQERNSITPRITERRLPQVIDIFKLLPRTNCRQCGYPTCMAFAADLRGGKAKLEQCLPLCQPGDTENVEKILSLFS